MKKNLMKVYCFLSSFLIILMLSTINFASDSIPDMDGVSGIDGMETGAGLANRGEKGIGTGINTILGIIETLGTGALIISITVMGIKYLAAGPNEKVDVKKQMLPWLIGSVLLFSATKVVDKIAELAKEVPVI